MPQVAHIHEIEANLKKAELYEPVAETLILYCQSDPKFFPRTLGPVWFPPALEKQGRLWATATAGHGHVEFGGGFFHFGYMLKLDETASTPTSNVWHLFLHSEDAPETLLCTKTVSPTHSLSATELLKRILRNYDDILAKNPLSEDAHKGKITLLLRFDHPADARAACRAMLEKLPDNSWANIACRLGNGC